MYVMDVAKGAMSPTVMRLSKHSPLSDNKKAILVSNTTLTRRNDKRRIFLGKSQESQS